MKRKTKSYSKSDASEGTRTQRPTSPLELGRFAERIKTLVGDGSARAFARAAGIDDKSLRNYMERGTEPSLGAVIGIAKAAGVNLEWLATGEGPMRKGEGQQVAPLDRELMHLVVEEVERLLVDVDGYLEPEKKAELIVLLYEEVRESEGKVDRARVLKLIKLAS